jgi:hypothetical protein
MIEEIVPQTDCAITNGNPDDKRCDQVGLCCDQVGLSPIPIPHVINTPPIKKQKHPIK